MKLRHRLATEIRRGLKEVYKRLEAEKTKEYEAKGEEATENADPTRMYFERWGLLAPPLEKSELLKKYSCSASPNMDTIAQPQKAYHLRRAGVLACKKLS